MKAIEDTVFGKAAKWFYDCDSYYDTIDRDFEKLKDAISADLEQPPFEAGLTKANQSPLYSAAAQLDNLLGSDLEAKARKRKAYFYDDPKEEETDLIKAARYIYTSQTDYYVEDMGWEGEEPEYYAEVDGVRYPALSKETVILRDWHQIDFNFLNGTLDKLIAKADEKKTDVFRVLKQSLGDKGELNFKLYLDEGTLYMINGVLYNNNEAGNFVWTYYLEANHISGGFAGMLAQAGSLAAPILNGGESRLDESWDYQARWEGVKYYYHRRGEDELFHKLYDHAWRP